MIFGNDMVFGRLVNVSVMGACIDAPARFRLRIGDELRLQTPVHDGRPLFKVVAANGNRLHLARVA
jgi:hypothetical protein